MTLYVPWSWIHFFPELLLLKSTPSELVVIGWIVLWSLRRWRRRSFGWWYLCAFAAGYLALAMLSRVYIGQRHLLPMYAALFVLAGALARMAAGRRRLQWLLAGVVVAQAVSSFWVCPRYLPYFNAIAWSPERGSRCFVDSNVDWGQDLSRLKSRLEELGISEVHLLYAGTADPRAYGIPYRRTLWWHDMRPDEPPNTPGPGDHVAISLTVLRMFHGPLRETLDRLRPIGKAGDTILIYRLPDR
jgi:hypothetical protein